MDADDLSRMNSVLRHRLRNFASGIKSAVSLIATETEGVIDPGLSEYFPLIINECNELDKLTGRLSLLFSSSADGGISNVGSAADVLLSNLHSEFPTMVIDLECDETLSELTIVASGHVIIALKELVKNSVEADPRGRVIISCSLSDGVLHWRVRDFGAGVVKDDLEKIFLPFYTTKSRHIGIGLAIARKLIGEAGGSVEAVCSNGEGLTIDLGIPVVKGE